MTACYSVRRLGLIASALKLQVKRCNFQLSVSPSSAEALVRLGGKIKYHLTAYFRSNTPVKKLSKSVDVSQSYSKPKQSFLQGHSVVHYTYD